MKTSDYISAEPCGREEVYYAPTCKCFATIPRLLLNFGNAQNLCKSLGGDLPSFATLYELNFIRNVGEHPFRLEGIELGNVGWESRLLPLG